MQRSAVDVNITIALNKSSDSKKWRIIVSPSKYLVLSTFLMCLVAGANSAPGNSASSPDLLIVAYTLPGGGSDVSLTYPSVVPRSQALRDVAELERKTGETFRKVVVSDDVAPIKATKHHHLTRMTSVEFISALSLSNSPHSFAVGPLIDAFKSYPRMAFTYFEEPSFQFQGLRDYQNEFVTVKFAKHGNTYTYFVAIRNAHFKKLSLPVYSPDPSSIHVSSNTPVSHVPVALKWGLIAIGAIGTCIVAQRIALKFN